MVHAQSNYVYVSPKPNSILVSNQTNIIFRSSSIVDPNSLVSSLVSVHGSQSGLHTGKLILSDDKRTIVFNPDQQFIGDEIVYVIIESGVKTLKGELLPSYSFSFSIMPEGAKLTAQAMVDYSNQSPNSTTQYLPAPPITIDTVDNPSQGYIFMATWDRNAPQHVYANYLFILDNYGSIIDSVRVNGAPFDFKVQPNGLLSYGLGNYSGITPGNSNLTHYVMDSTLAVVDSFQMKNGYLTDFHDFILLPNGHAMLMSYTTIIYDMSLIVPGGRPDAQLVINIFQEQDTDKNVVFEWRDIDYIPITDTDLNLTAPRINPSTLNAFDLDDDGNLLFSFRNHSDIMKISRETGDILWRWGGLKNEFTFFGEHPENAPYYFARQHDIRRLSNGNVSIFDNGEFHTPWYSRAAEYQLDEVNKTATLVSEFRYSPGNIMAQAAGNAQMLSDGGWFIGYGIIFPASPVKRNIVEVHGDGSIAFELSLPNNVIAYRVSKQPWKELIQRVLVSNAEVLEGNTYSFNEEGKITGVSIKYVQLTGNIYNSVTVTRIPYGPINPEFISESPIISPVSIIYEGSAISSHTSEIHIDLNAYPEIKHPKMTSIFMREFPGQGLFIELPTIYDSTANELVANTTIFGEIIFGRPDLQQGLVSPFLIEPLNNKKVLANEPVTLKWSGRGLVESFNLQLAEDSLFTMTVLDTTTINSFVQISDLIKNQNYFWRVSANGTLGTSNWSQVWNFEPNDAFIQVLSPNGGEVFALSDTTIIRWETNISDSVRLDLLQGETTLDVIGKSLASINAFRWIIPTNLIPGSFYRIRIVSTDNTEVSDSSDTVFSLMNPSGIDSTDNDVPTEFNLYQNYPNPFNASTVISYTLPNSGIVQLKLFNLLGQEIITLINEEKSAGKYQIDFDASSLPSGVYFYRLQIYPAFGGVGDLPVGESGFVETKKMLLLK
jgi:hypothetical protein